MTVDDVRPGKCPILSRDILILSRDKKNVACPLWAIVKCLHILRTLRRECYNESHVNHLLKTLFPPNFLHALTVGASESDLSTYLFGK